LPAIWNFSLSTTPVLPYYSCFIYFNLFEVYIYCIELSRKIFIISLFFSKYSFRPFFELTFKTNKTLSYNKIKAASPDSPGTIKFSGNFTHYILLDAAEADFASFPMLYHRNQDKIQRQIQTWSCPFCFQ